VSREDRSHWDQHHDRLRESGIRAPAPFVAEHASLLVPSRTLDLAAGSGRNAIFLAALGHRVLAVDSSRSALDTIRGSGHPIDLAQVDLDDPGFQTASVDNLVCVNFLDRRLFPEIERWLRPGGVLLFDTFLVDQQSIGHPKNPDFLLGRNELLERLRGYRILRYREGAVTGDSGTSYRAGAVAVRP
jgi:SAM-dependent methyltransferase